MPQNRNPTHDETPTAATSAENLLRQVLVRQHINDAPVLYLQVFDDPAPTVGATVPLMVLPIPAGISGQASTQKYTFHGSRGGLHLVNGLTFAVTSTHDGGTGPDAGDEPEVIVDYSDIT